MQNSLNLKTRDIPDSFSIEAKALCQDLVDEVDRTHTYYKEQIAFLRQRFRIAIKQLSPTLITQEALRGLFDEAEMNVSPDVDVAIEDDAKAGDEDKKKKPRKKKKRAIPEHLPRTIVEHDLAAELKQCANDGTALRQIGYDAREELKYTPAKFEVIEHRYPKYACQTCREGVLRASSEPSLVSESYVSSSLLAHIAVSKFTNHLPLYRLEQIFNREGIHITRQVMASWVIKLGVALRPLIGLMHERILESEVVSADETPVKLLTKDGVRTSTQCYMWQLSRWGPKPLVIFEYDQTRKKEVASRLFKDYAGYVQIDGYAGYDILFDQASSQRKRVGCMAHCFRKFRDFLQTLDKEKRSDHPARNILALIDKLYDIEEPLKRLLPSERLKERLKSDASKIFDELQAIVLSEREQVSKNSPYYTALHYACEELPSIRRYLEHGQIEIDNNYAENAIRPFALGRRNWLFICSEKGAEASANIYSLLITAKANHLEPYAYLEKVIQKLPHCRTLQDYEALLPA